MDETVSIVSTSSYYEYHDVEFQNYEEVLMFMKTLLNARIVNEGQDFYIEYD